MSANGITQEAFISKVEVYLDVDYTDEQKELIKVFGDKPTFCFADPGTGKTYTAIGGLLNAELFKGIPGENIYALSFTRMATGELAVRHERACQKLGISKTVNFSTLHSLCRSILAENYRKLGMIKFGSSENLTMAESVSLIENSCNEWGVSLPPNKIRNVVEACRSLNSALVFDEDNVKTKMAFKTCDIDYELFERIRGLLFSYALLIESVSISDILLYTLMLMQRFPEVSTEFKAKCKCMLVDEAQDLSLLHLRVISMLTDNPIFIGDMKQQIYAFNGACQEIVQAFFKLYPDATSLQLTKSFRCKNEIAEFATKIILHNSIGGENFTGTGDGGSVIIHNSAVEDGVDLQSLCESLKVDFMVNRSTFSKDYLFLFRNNTSAIPIAEELYKSGLPFRVNKYQPAYEVPVVREMCELLRLCATPYDYSLITSLRYLIPEFKGYYNMRQHPFYEICTQMGCSVFEVNYQFKDIATGNKAMSLLLDIQEMMRKGATVKEMFNHLWPMYEENWVRQNSWKLEASVKYYLNNVAPLVDKTYVQFMQDEMKKLEIINESIKFNRGVRCYTMHASKGLEADIVYILDADTGLIPNDNKLKKMLDKQCDMDAARAVREERSLCYVACTRAKEELHIIYNNEIAPMLLGENPYKQYDDVYQYYKVTGDDIRAFEKFTEEYVKL